MIIPSAQAPGFQIHLVPWTSRGPVPANHFQSRDELVIALDRLQIKPDLQSKILKSIDRGELYHVPSIELQDELASQFGWEPRHLASIR